MNINDRPLSYQELRNVARQLYEPAQMLQVIQNFLNIGGDTRMRTYLLSTGQYYEGHEEPLLDWHPTIQQCLMKGLIAPSIRSLSHEKHPDPRNISTVKFCNEVVPVLDKYTFPLV